MCRTCSRDFQTLAEQRYLGIVERGETIPWSEMRDDVLAIRGQRQAGYSRD
jgi:hypothetical protein